MAEKKERGFARHFEGWQPGLVAVFIAGSVAALVVPRPVEPIDLPAPAVDERAIARQRRADEALAQKAEKARLDVDVRELGSAFRAYGRAEAESRNKLDERNAVVQAALRAMAVSAEQVAELRAYQLRAFMNAARVWAATGKKNDDLIELGGGFAFHRESKALASDDAALETSFKLRWLEITGIRGEAFDPSLDERRALYRFALRSSPVSPPPAKGASGDEAGLAQAMIEQARLRKLEELIRIDPTYPADLARGILHCRIGKYALALGELQRYVDAQPNGPYALRAQNYLAYALAHAKAEEQEQKR